MPRNRTLGRGALTTLIALVSLALLYAAPTAWAAPGDLDPSFSGDGKATVNFGGDEAWDPYADMALTPEGNIVLVGRTTAVASIGSKSIAIAEVLPDGSLNPAFGGGDGLVVRDFGYEAWSGAVAVQPDGKIVVVGYDLTETNAYFFDVLRFNADGSPDASFGTNGLKSVPFAGQVKEGYGVAIAPDGRIVVAGLASTDANPNNLNTAIAVLSQNGQLDNSFSGDGMLTTTSSGPDYAYDAAVQPDGKIVVAGARGGSMSVRRYFPNGNPDPLFGSGGVADVDFPNGASYALDAALQADGSILLAGSAGDPNGDFAVARLQSNGGLDPTFSGDGELTLDLGSAYDYARDIAIQSDGKIIVGGDGGDSQRNLVATRLNPDGSPDTSFAGGLAQVSFASETQYGGHVAIQANGSVLLSGVTYNNDDFAIARLLGDSPPAEPPPPIGVDETDTTPPETTIYKFPKDHIHKSKAKYKFRSSEPGSIFECALDSKTFEPCGNGKVKYKHLDFGKHHFLVRATDPTGNTDQSPARDKFARKR